MSNYQLSITNYQLPEGYKQTEVGVIPEDWDVKELGNLGKFKNGINKSSEDFGYGSPFVNLMDVFGISFIEDNTHLGLVNSNEIEKKVYDLRKGDVLFIRSSVKPSGVGLTTVINRDLADTVYSGFLIRFRDSGCLEKDFKRYCFSEEKLRQRVIANSTVSANTNSNQDNLKKIPIAYPQSIKEQSAIAATLSDVDALIAALDKLIAKQRHPKAATMQQLLTGKKRLPKRMDNGELTIDNDGNPVMFGPSMANCQLSINNYQLPKGYKQTEVGLIPEDWEVTTLKSVSNVPMQNGVFYKPSHKGSGVKLINVGDLYNQTPINSENLELFNASDDEKSRFRVEDGDLFFTHSSVVPSGIAHCNVYFSDQDESVVFDSHVIRVRPDNKQIDPAYLFRFCISPVARKYLISHAKTGTMTTIDQGVLGECPVFLPKLFEQTAIATVLSDMDAAISALEARRTKTQAIKQGMMQELLTGRTRLV